MTRSSIRVGVGRRAHRLGAIVMTVALLTATAQAVAAAVPSNDLVSAPTKLALGVAVDYNSADATISASDPTDCDGSHGSFPGPYFASVWFSFTATSNGQLNLSAPTTQGRADDYLAISFVYQQTGSGLTLIDCTAFGNDATWPARKGETFLIMEAGLSSAVTEFPPLSDMGGHGTIAITRSANEAHYSYIDRFTYADCGFTVNGEQFGSGHVPPPGRSSRATRRRTSSTTTSGTSSRRTRRTGSGSGRTARASTATSTSPTSRARSTRSCRRRRAGRTP